jgi:hypothetical protein
MHHLSLALTRFHLQLVAPPRRDERGDVPGWVLITVMSAGLVAGLWAIAGSQLSTMLRDALSSVTG